MDYKVEPLAEDNPYFDSYDTMSQRERDLEIEWLFNEAKDQAKNAKSEEEAIKAIRNGLSNFIPDKYKYLIKK